MVPGEAPDNLLYLNSTFPVDALGLMWQFESPIQLPGLGPNADVTSINIYYNASPQSVVEGRSERIDPSSTAFVSNVPGFNNITFPLDSNNIGQVLYSACQAPIIGDNGEVAPVEPRVANSAKVFDYSYSVGDDAHYTVQVDLTLTASTAFANSRDMLGDVYQTIVNVTGVRNYTHLPSGCQVISAVSGLSFALNPSASQRWYTFAFLVGNPYYVTMDTAPFLDSEGLEYSVSPPVPANGDSAGCSGALYGAVNVAWVTTQAGSVLTEGGASPSAVNQQQVYTL